MDCVALSRCLLLCCLQSGQVELAGSYDLWCLLRHQGAGGPAEDQGVEALHQAEADEDKHGELHLAGVMLTMVVETAAVEHW